jgi:hypothetical protein
MLGRINKNNLKHPEKLIKVLRQISGEVNATQDNLSPYHFNNMPVSLVDKNKDEGFDLAWTFHYKKDGHEITVDMFNAIRDLEAVTGKQYIYTDTTTAIRKSELTDEIENIKKNNKKVKDLEEE